MFCLLNMITGILECGWISFGLAHAMPLWQILCYPLAYYLGKLFPKPFSLPKKLLFVFCSVTLIAAVILTFVPMPDIVRFVLTCLCLFLLSAVIQTVKDSIKSGEHSLLKRFFRVAGFALSPLAAFRPQIILFVAVVIAFCGLTKAPDLKGGYSIAILFHQLHYFFYTHITIAAVSLALSKQPPVIDALDYAFTRNPAVFGSIAGILIFCGTQIIYFFTADKKEHDRFLYRTNCCLCYSAVYEFYNGYNAFCYPVAVYRLMRRYGLYYNQKVKAICKI